jgi:hypothetical protein
LTLPIVAFGAMAVKAASDSEETFSKFATVFRDVGANADEAFKSLRDNYGLSSKASKQLLSDTGDLLTGFGFSQQSALELSTEVNKLAVDLASFTNFSGGAEGASQALTKALLGERDSIKSLGISIMEEDVQKRVAINTAKGLTFETDRQAKAFATLQLAQEQSKNAIGDYERTQGGFANQFKLLGQRTNDLAVEFGTVLLPTLTKLVGFMTKVTESLSKMDSGTKRLVLTLTGFAAGIGPVLLGIGFLTKGIEGLTLAMTRNPYTAVAIGILAIGTAAYIALNGISELDSELAKKAGVTTVTGTQDERNRLIKLRDEINANKDATEALIKAGVTPQEGSYLIGQIALYREQIVQINETIKKSNDLSSEKQQLAKRAKDAADEAERLKNLLGGTTTELVAQAGSIGALEAELEGLQGQLKITGDTLNRAQLGAQINQLTAEIKAMKDVAMANILPITNPLERATIATQNLTSSITGLNRGFIPLAKAPAMITVMTAEMVIAQQFAQQFTDSFGAGMANIIVQGDRLTDVLKNIGKLLLSSAIQTGIKLLLMGTSGFGITGGTTGLLGGLFKPSISAVPTSVMGAGTTSVTGTFTMQGTDLIAVINRSQRQFR